MQKVPKVGEPQNLHISPTDTSVIVVSGVEVRRLPATISGHPCFLTITVNGRDFETETKLPEFDEEDTQSTRMEGALYSLKYSDICLIVPSKDLHGPRPTPADGYFFRRGVHVTINTPDMEQNPYGKVTSLCTGESYHLAHPRADVVVHFRQYPCDDGKICYAPALLRHHPDAQQVMAPAPEVISYLCGAAPPAIENGHAPLALEDAPAGDAAAAGEPAELESMQLGDCLTEVPRQEGEVAREAEETFEATIRSAIGKDDCDAGHCPVRLCNFRLKGFQNPTTDGQWTLKFHGDEKESPANRAVIRVPSTDSTGRAQLDDVVAAEFPCSEEEVVLHLQAVWFGSSTDGPEDAEIHLEVEFAPIALTVADHVTHSRCRRTHVPIKQGLVNLPHELQVEFDITTRKTSPFSPSITEGEPVTFYQEVAREVAREVAQEEKAREEGKKVKSEEPVQEFRAAAREEGFAVAAVVDPPEGAAAGAAVVPYMQTARAASSFRRSSTASEPLCVATYAFGVEDPSSPGYIKSLVPCYTDEQRDLAFNYYDQTGAGYITRDQLLQFCRSHVTIFSKSATDKEIYEALSPYFSEPGFGMSHTAAAAARKGRPAHGSNGVKRYAKGAKARNPDDVSYDLFSVIALRLASR